MRQRKVTDRTLGNTTMLVVGGGQQANQGEEGWSGGRTTRRQTEATEAKGGVSGKGEDVVKCCLSKFISVIRTSSS